MVGWHFGGRHIVPKRAERRRAWGLEPLDNDSIHSMMSCRKQIMCDHPLDFGSYVRTGDELRRSIVTRSPYDRLVIHIRQSASRPENYSIMLTYESKGDRERVILRYDGFHRERMEDGRMGMLKPHIHMLVNTGEAMNPMMVMRLNADYTTLEEAWAAFANDINIECLKSFDNPGDESVRER